MVRLLIVLAGLSLVPFTAAHAQDPAPPAAPAPAPTPESAPTPTPEKPEPRVITRTRPGMGTRLQVLIWTDGSADHEAKAQAGIDAAFAELDRIEGLMSEWLPDSEVSRINKAAGTPEGVVVSPETLEVLQTGKAISVATEGAFSLSWAALSGLWRFDGQGAADAGTLPDPATARTRAALVDDDQVFIDPGPRTVRLGHAEMAIGLGGIAKGYSLDRALAVLRERGITDALVFAGGDIAAMGSKGERPWLVGIQDPRAAGYFATIPIRDEAVVSSGDYERYFEVDGKRYHHILDRRTGYPAEGTRSVTVLTKDGLSGDAYATAVFVLGPEKGLAFVEDNEGIEAMIIAADNSIILSSGLKDRVRILREPSS